MWVTVREAARRLGVPEESVLDLVRCGKVHFSLGGSMKTKVRLKDAERAVAEDAEERLRGGAITKIFWLPAGVPARRTFRRIDRAVGRASS